jgi:hypothetical protein
VLILVVSFGSSIASSATAAEQWYVDFSGVDWDESQIRRAIAL